MNRDVLGFYKRSFQQEVEQRFREILRLPVFEFTMHHKGKHGTDIIIFTCEVLRKKEPEELGKIAKASVLIGHIPKEEICTVTFTLPLPERISHEKIGTYEIKVETRNEELKEKIRKIFEDSKHHFNANKFELG